MSALEVLAPTLRQPTVDREVISALWHLCHLASRWGLDKDGMLQRNDLINPSDVDTLREWIYCISYATMILLAGGSSEEAFSPVEKLLAWVQNLRE